MYKTVLLCYDGSAEGRKALREGALLARAMGAQTHLLAICRDLASTLMPEAVTSTLVECEEHVAQSILDQGVQKLRELGIDAQGTLLIGDPTVHIPSFAAKIAADRGAATVRPYDDPDIIAGQGTVGLEIHRQSRARGAARSPRAAPRGPAAPCRCPPP